MTDALPVPLAAVTVLPPEKPASSADAKAPRKGWVKTPPPQCLVQWMDTRNALAEVVRREREKLMAGTRITDEERLAMLTMLAVILGKSESAMLKAYREYQEMRVRLLERIEVREICAQAGRPPPRMVTGLL